TARVRGPSLRICESARLSVSEVKDATRRRIRADKDKEFAVTVVQAIVAQATVVSADLAAPAVAVALGVEEAAAVEAPVAAASAAEAVDLEVAKTPSATI